MNQVSAEQVAVRSLVCRYGSTTALDHIDLAFGAGVTVLLGPNGAGKSTLMRCLLGNKRADAGRVEVLGADPARDVGLARRVGFLPQQPQLPGQLRTQDVVAYAGWLKGLSWRAARSAARDALATVDLAEDAERPIKALSGGMQRRVALAAACVHRPDVLLLDEPMSGLDPEQRARLRGLIRSRADDGTCLLVATHILQDLPDLADRVVVLGSGRVRFAGGLDDLLAGGAQQSTWADLEQAYLNVLGG